MVKVATNSFNGVIAEKYGIEEAILLNNFNLWTSPAKDNPNDRTYFDGRYWVNITLKEIHSIFKYMSENAIRRAINNLVSENLILKNDFNRSYLEKSLWYALTDSAITICENSHMEVCKSTNYIYLSSYYNCIYTNKLYLKDFNNINNKNARTREEIYNLINEYNKNNPHLIKAKAYGKYKNVFLTDKEFENIQHHFPKPEADIPWHIAIDTVSGYIFNHPEKIAQIDGRYYWYLTEYWNYDSAVKNYKAKLRTEEKAHDKDKSKPKKSDKYTKEQIDSLYSNLDEVEI